jgi:hypothetical protein
MLKIRLLGLVLLLMPFAACEKEEMQTKAINVEVWGYNVGNAVLEASIDTTIYRAFATQPDKAIIFSKIYTFSSDKGTASFKMTDKTTGKDVFTEQLDLRSSNRELFFPFVYLNGNPLKLELPVADTATNKLAFYIHYPQSEDPLDIFLRNEAGQMYYIAKGVKPGAWIKADYMAAEGFKDKTKSYWLCFTKAGTTQNWYFGATEYLSSVTESSLLLPKMEEKGLVRSFFVTPGNQQLDVIRLFKRP